jgi:hypothetical protein
MPPAVRARYREHFLTFKDYCGEHGVTALSAHGATVATWLLHLAAVERRTLAEVNQAAEAVRYYHSLQGDACTDAALSIAAKIGGGVTMAVELNRTTAALRCRRRPCGKIPARTSQY